MENQYKQKKKPKKHQEKRMCHYFSIQSGYRHKDGPIRYKGLKRARKTKENQGQPKTTKENQGTPKIVRYPSET